MSEEQDRVRQWMMAALDGELGENERAELDRRLAADEELRKEWEQMGRVRDVTRSMSFREPPEETWDAYWAGTYRRAERGVAWVLLSLGVTVLFAYGVWRWMETLLGDTSTPLFLRLSILAVVVGGALLFVSVAREKLFARRNDAYKEIQR